MSGQQQDGKADVSDDQGPSLSYRIRRRNASVGDNISHFNRHLQETASRAQGSGAILHRTRFGGIESRKPHHQPNGGNYYYKPHNNRYSKDNRLSKNWVEKTYSRDDVDTAMMKQTNAHQQSDNIKLNSSMKRPRDPKLNPRFLDRIGNQVRFAPGVKSSSKEASLKIGDDAKSSQHSLITSLPNCKLATMPQIVFDLIVQFLKQYFACYDKDRNELIAAYHAKASLSLSLNVNSSAAPCTFKFGSYFKESRNLVHVSNEEKRFSILHRGNGDIITTLNKMPQTEHIPDSFKLDTCLSMPNMITFSVSGVFREGKLDDKIRPFRAFQRVFVCVPITSENMVIVNEQYLITNLSKDLSKIYKYEPAKRDDLQENISITVRNDMPTTSSSIATSSSSISQLENYKLDQIQRFSLETKLNLKWSKDCLEFSKWDFDLALKTFHEHQNEIPRDAYNII